MTKLMMLIDEESIDLFFFSHLPELQLSCFDILNNYHLNNVFNRTYGILLN